MFRRNFWVADGGEGNESGTSGESEVPEISEPKESGSSGADSGIQQGSGELQLEGFDPNKLAPELKAVYKNMQSGWTKKTQSLAEERKAIAAERAQLRETMEYLQRTQAQNSQEGRSGTQSRKGQDEEDELLRKYNPEGREFIQNLDKRYGSQVQSAVEYVINEMDKREAMATVRRLTREHGEKFTSRVPEMQQLIRSGKVNTVEDAFEFLTAPDRARAEAEKKFRSTAPKASSTGTGFEGGSDILGMVGMEEGGGETPSSGKFKTIYDAAKFAKKQQEEGKR